MCSRSMGKDAVWTKDRRLEAWGPPVSFWFLPVSAWSQQKSPSLLKDAVTAVFLEKAITCAVSKTWYINLNIYYCNCVADKGQLSHDRIILQSEGFASNKLQSFKDVIPDSKADLMEGFWSPHTICKVRGISFAIFLPIHVKAMAMVTKIETSLCVKSCEVKA